MNQELSESHLKHCLAAFAVLLHLKVKRPAGHSPEAAIDGLIAGMDFGVAD